MDLLGGLPLPKFGSGYMFVVVDRFIKMIILIPCKKTITGEEADMLFSYMYETILDYLRQLSLTETTAFLATSIYDGYTTEEKYILLFTIIFEIADPQFEIAP